MIEYLARSAYNQYVFQKMTEGIEMELLWGDVNKETMSIHTKEPEKKSAKEIRDELRVHHEPVLKGLGVPEAVFIPKMAYKPTGKSELFISFFPSEVKRGQDLYVEFTSREFVPEDPNRKLYKWKYNPDYEDKYEKTSNAPDFRYLVPVAELEVMSIPVETHTEFELPDPEMDLPLDRLTILDLAAIIWKSPISKKDFINQAIEKENK